MVIEIISLKLHLKTEGPRATTHFPYTTLFRSRRGAGGRHRRGPRGKHGRHPVEADRQMIARVVAFDHLTIRFNRIDRKSTRLNSSHLGISYAVFCLKKKNQTKYLFC